MTTNLKGRTALVTGSGNGIGKEVALLLGAEGANVVVNDLGTSAFGEGQSSDAADATVRQIVDAGGAAVANYDSVADPDGCRNSVQTALDAFGSIDIVVANAGSVIRGSLAGIQSDDASWQAMVNLYLGQKFWLARLAVPHMVERGWGRMLFATSEIARGTQSSPIGAMVMNGSIGLSHDLANQYRGSGLTFNSYAPAAGTRTFDLYKDARPDAPAHAPGNYLPPADRIAPMLAWLCTDAAHDVTGEVFALTGSRVTRWTHVQDGPSIEKNNDLEALWDVDELSAVVSTGLFTASDHT